MTRDEAIEAIAPVIGRAMSCSITVAYEAASTQVDIYAALGILKLDEPTSTIEDRVIEIISRHTKSDQLQCIQNALKNAKVFS